MSVLAIMKSECMWLPLSGTTQETTKVVMWIQLKETLGDKRGLITNPHVKLHGQLQR